LHQEEEQKNLAGPARKYYKTELQQLEDYKCLKHSF